LIERVEHCQPREKEVCAMFRSLISTLAFVFALSFTIASVHAFELPQSIENYSLDGYLEERTERCDTNMGTHAIVHGLSNKEIGGISFIVEIGEITLVTFLWPSNEGREPAVFARLNQEADWKKYTLAEAMTEFSAYVMTNCTPIEDAPSTQEQ